MLTGNKKMYYAFSSCIFASPANVAVWESLTQVLRVPAGLLAGDGQSLLQSPIFWHGEERGLGI